MKEAPTGERFAFYFYGSEPSDWFESEGEEGYAYEVCFQESHSDAERAKIEQTLSTTLQEHGSVFDVQWAGPWLLFRIKPSSDDRDDVRSMFNAARTALQAVHSSFTITEAINAAASEDDSDWNLWTIEAQPIPSPGPKWSSSVPEISGRQRYETTIDNAPERATRSSHSEDEEEGGEDEDEESSEEGSSEGSYFTATGSVKIVPARTANATKRVQELEDRGHPIPAELREKFGGKGRLHYVGRELRAGLMRPSGKGSFGFVFDDNAVATGISFHSQAQFTVRSDEREVLLARYQNLYAISIPDGTKRQLFESPSDSINSVAYLQNDLIAIGTDGSLMLTRRNNDQLEVLARYPMSPQQLFSLANGRVLGSYDYDEFKVFVLDGERLRLAGTVTAPASVMEVDGVVLLSDGDTQAIEFDEIETTLTATLSGDEATYPEPRRWGTPDPNYKARTEEVDPSTETIELENLPEDLRNALQDTNAPYGLEAKHIETSFSVPPHLQELYEGASIQATRANRILVLHGTDDGRRRFFAIQDGKEQDISADFPANGNLYQLRERLDRKATLYQGQNHHIFEFDYETKESRTVLGIDGVYSSYYEWLSNDAVVLLDSENSLHYVAREGAEWKVIARVTVPNSDNGISYMGARGDGKIFAIGMYGEQGTMIFGAKDRTIRVLASSPLQPNEIVSRDGELYVHYDSYYFQLTKLEQLYASAFAEGADEAQYPKLEEWKPAPEENDESEDGDDSEEEGEQEPAAPPGRFAREATATSVGLAFLGTEATAPDRQWHLARKAFGKGASASFVNADYAVGWMKKGKGFVFATWDRTTVRPTTVESKKRATLLGATGRPGFVCATPYNSRTVYLVSLADNEATELGKLPDNISNYFPVYPLNDGFYLASSESDDEEFTALCKVKDGAFEIVQKLAGGSFNADPEFARNGSVLFLSLYDDNCTTHVLGFKAGTFKTLGKIANVGAIYTDSNNPIAELDDGLYELTNLDEVLAAAFAPGADASFDQLPVPKQQEASSEEENEEESEETSEEESEDESQDEASEEESDEENSGEEEESEEEESDDGDDEEGGEDEDSDDDSEEESDEEESDDEESDEDEEDEDEGE